MYGFRILNAMIRRSAGALSLVLLTQSALLLGVGCDSSEGGERGGPPGHEDSGLPGRDAGNTATEEPPDASGEAIDSGPDAEARRDAGSDSGSDADAGLDSDSRCPAYPAMPDAMCTGVIPGTQLKVCDGRITRSDATYTGCLFPDGVAIAASVKNLEISNSKIERTIYPQTTLARDLEVVLTDVEIDGKNARQAAWGYGARLTCVRCNVHSVTIGFQYGGYTIVDSYIHDLYGFGDSHNEAILVGGGNVVLRHNRLEGNFGASSTGGGMSASVAMYTHGDFWGPLDNVLIENNRIITEDAYYCLYGGHSSDTDGLPSNIQVIGNVFGPCSFEGPKRGAVVGWLRGNGNVWRDNTWDDGTAIPEPTTSPYN